MSPPKDPSLSSNEIFKAKPNPTSLDLRFKVWVKGVIFMPIWTCTAVLCDGFDI